MTYNFLKETGSLKKQKTGYFKVLIADDDQEVHTITKMVLKDFEFEGKGIQFLHAYSGEETKKIIRETKDIAVVFLDVVMEETHSGLKVVEYIRNDLKNNMVRIVLRTGQPGEAPEEFVLRNFDINDYRLKTEITVSRLYTIMYTALRGHSDLRKLEKHKTGLEKIIETSANIFKNDSYSEFLSSILSELSNFYSDQADLIYLREVSGFVALEKSNQFYIVAASGKYEKEVGKTVQEIESLKKLQSHFHHEDAHTQLESVDEWYIIKNSRKGEENNVILIEDPHKIFDVDLIKLFLTNYSVALDNYILNNRIFETQKEIIFTLGEVVEKHFDETSKHVNRMSDMMYRFTKLLGYSNIESELIKIACTLHDIGKIGIPDAILKKPGKLTEEEFTEIKKHTEIGYKILSRSDLEVFHIAAEIAYNHHERFDGTGYPNGIKGNEIPKSARVLAILDVFDAMTHERVYKEASSHEQCLEYISNNKNRHFDPELVDLFLNQFKWIVYGEEESGIE